MTRLDSALVTTLANIFSFNCIILNSFRFVIKLRNKKSHQITNAVLLCTQMANLTDYNNNFYAHQLNNDYALCIFTYLHTQNV